jgi:hypothetical protein
MAGSAQLGPENSAADSKSSGSKKSEKRSKAEKVAKPPKPARASKSEKSSALKSEKAAKQSSSMLTSPCVASRLQDNVSFLKLKLTTDTGTHRQKLQYGRVPCR